MAGYTTLISKTQAFLWVLQLELPNHDASKEERDHILRKYCHQVISITSDQGVEFGFGSLPELRASDLLQDSAAVLQSTPEQGQQRALHDEVSSHSAPLQRL